MASSFKTLVALVSLLLPLSALGAQRDHQLRWIVPPEPDVAGYQVYLALASMAYGGGTDIGFRSPDPNGGRYRWRVSGIDRGCRGGVFGRARWAGLAGRPGRGVRAGHRLRGCRLRV